MIPRLFSGIVRKAVVGHGLKQVAFGAMSSVVTDCCDRHAQFVSLVREGWQARAALKTLPILIALLVHFLYLHRDHVMSVHAHAMGAEEGFSTFWCGNQFCKSLPLLPHTKCATWRDSSATTCAKSEARWEETRFHAQEHVHYLTRSQVNIHEEYQRLFSDRALFTELQCDGGLAGGVEPAVELHQT